MTSRIGKVPVPVPAGVRVVIEGPRVTVEGPKGALEHVVPPALAVRQQGEEIVLDPSDDDRQTRALHGLTRSLLANLITGVTEGYSKRMLVVGTGYRVVAKGKDLEFTLGFSHPVTVTAPAGITFSVVSTSEFVVSGIDKQQVGEVAANIRKIRKPEPYKGKGVRYADESVRRKVGKAGK